MNPPNINSLLVLVPLSLVFLLGACGEQPQDAVAETPDNSLTTTAAPQDAVPAAPAETANVEKGMFFKPELNDYALHNEYDDDGDGDGVKETHVRRYINSKGDSAFSLTTNDKLWAWSLDTKADDDSDIKKNYVIRNSNCDSVFDERYSLNAEFHVPTCLMQDAAAEKGK
jgi:hypothetical protein